MRSIVTQEAVRELLEYQEDGFLIWKVSYCNKIRVGSIAGTTKPGTHGYHSIRVLGETYLLHQIIYLWHHGYIPEYIDHEDRIKINNRIDNLRDISNSRNMQNAGISKNNTSGVTGVSWYPHKSKWRAFIKIDYKLVTIGYYTDYVDAVKARYAKELEFNWSTKESAAYIYLTTIMEAN